MEEPALFDLSGKEFNPLWVDEKEALFVPNQPLHWKAHKLQLMIKRLDKQLEKAPAQFNSKNYIDTINEFTRVCEAINDGQERLDEGGVVEDGYEGSEGTVGEGDSAGVDLGVPAPNPITG